MPTASSPVKDRQINLPLLGERYQCLYELTAHRQDANSRVYAAFDVISNQTVILKCANADLPPQKVAFAKRMLMREQIILSRLMHPQIPVLRDHFTDPSGVFYLVLDYIEGNTIEELLVFWGGRAPVAMALFIATEVCRILEYLHTQVPHVIHRDIKPANIMLAPGGMVYLLDYGIAHCCLTPDLYLSSSDLQPGGFSITDIAVGSYGHAAPEQYELGRQVSERTDLFSVGVLLHQMLSGKDPEKKPKNSLFSFSALQQPELAAVTTLIAGLLKRRSCQRPPSAQVVREELEKALLPYCQ